MATKPNSLQAVLARQIAPAPTPEDEPTPAATTPPVSAPTRFHRPSREGKRLIAGHFSPSTAKALKLLAAEEETTVQALLKEAIDLLLVKKGKTSIRA